MKNRTSVKLYRCQVCGNDEVTADVTVEINRKKRDPIDWASSDWCRNWCQDCEESGIGGEKTRLLCPGDYTKTKLKELLHLRED